MKNKYNPERLISVARYVNKIKPKTRITNTETLAKLYTYVLSYTRLILKKPTLGMFIPCDENGNYLEEPKESDFRNYHGICVYARAVNKHRIAQERVIFEGWEIDNVSESKNMKVIRNKESNQRFEFWSDGEMKSYLMDLKKDEEYKEIKTLEDLTEYSLKLK